MAVALSLPDRALAQSPSVPVYNARADIEYISSGLTGGAPVWTGPRSPTNYNAPTIDPARKPDLGDPCPERLVIMVHGFNFGSLAESQAWFDDVGANLDAAGYQGAKVGVAWNSLSPTAGKVGFGRVQVAASMMAMALIDLVDCYKRECPGIKVHLLAHSLGAHVVTRALDFANRRNNREFCPYSINLWSGAYPANSFTVSAWHAPGPPLLESDPNDKAGVVSVIKNWYMPEDLVLKVAYRASRWIWGDPGGAIGNSPAPEDELLDGVEYCDVSQPLDDEAEETGEDSPNPNAGGTAPADPKEDHSVYRYSLKLAMKVVDVITCSEGQGVWE